MKTTDKRNTPQIGIIIPTLNEEKFIERCLDSVLAQTIDAKQMDIMIVDGGSTDKTIDIVRSIATKYPNIRILNNPKHYQSAAFNIGVQSSNTPYIIRLDAHAIYETSYCERCIALLHDHPDYGNVGGVCDIRPQNNSLIAKANALLNQLKFGIGGADFRVGTKAKETDSVPFGAFRRDIINIVGEMREDLARGEDNELNSRIRKAGYKIWLDPEIRSVYYARPTLQSSCKQMFANGKSIGILTHIDRKSIGIRHLIPFCFVSSIIFACFLSFFTIYGRYTLCAIWGAYCIAAIIADIEACRKYGWEYIFILPILFVCVHISYGFGTIVGLMQRKQ